MIVFSSPVFTCSGSTGSVSWKRSGCETGTEILMSEELAERTPPSTYSYLKLTVTPWAPLFALESACIGRLCVIAHPAYSVSK